MRPTFDEIAMGLAKNLSQRSTCKRLSVGCVIFSADFQRMLSWGYNGNARGLPNTCDSEEPGLCGCVHAETNAVIKCREAGVIEKLVFCTHQPCKMCAKVLVNLGGVVGIYYLEPYRLRDGLDVLSAAGVPYERVVAR